MQSGETVAISGAWNAEFRFSVLPLRISLQSDHPFRSNPISRFGGFRSPADGAVSALT
jgi:hypothetical protein